MKLKKILKIAFVLSIGCGANAVAETHHSEQVSRNYTTTTKQKTTTYNTQQIRQYQPNHVKVEKEIKKNNFLYEDSKIKETTNDKKITKNNCFKDSYQMINELDTIFKKNRIDINSSRLKTDLEGTLIWKSVSSKNKKVFAEKIMSWIKETPKTQEKIKKKLAEKYIDTCKKI